MVSSVNVKIDYILSTTASPYDKAQSIYWLLLNNDPDVFVKHMDQLDTIKELASTDPEYRKRIKRWHYKDREPGEKVLHSDIWYSSSVNEDTYTFSELGLPLVKTDGKKIYVNMRIMEDLEDQGGLLNYNFLNYIKNILNSIEYLNKTKQSVRALFVELPSRVSQLEKEPRKLKTFERQKVLVIDIVSGKEMLM